MSPTTTPPPAHAGGTVEVIVGINGADVWPVAAHLGTELRDGLAVRVIPRDAMMVLGATGRDWRHLPAAASRPDANLAIVGPWSRTVLHEEVRVAEEAAHQVRHRLTVAPRDPRTLGNIDHLIEGVAEVGDVAVAARDSVLRTGGTVQIEADGYPVSQTAVNALTAVGIQPWASYVDHLIIWLVVSVSVPALDDVWLDRVLAGVQANGGPPPLPGNVAMMLAVTGLEERYPDLEGFDEESDFDISTWESVSLLIGRIEEHTGVPVKLATTGPDTTIDLR